MSPTDTQYYPAVDDALLFLKTARRHLQQSRIAKQEFGDRLEKLIQDMELQGDPNLARTMRRINLPK